LNVPTGGLCGDLAYDYLCIGLNKEKSWQSSPETSKQLRHLQQNG